MADTVSRQASVADFTFVVADYTTEDFRVLRFEVQEAISELFHARIDLCSENADVDITTLVGEPAALEIFSPEGPRYINGIVRSVERQREIDTFTYYAVEIVPAHWLLTKRINTRWFQEHNCSDMTVPGVIKKVFEIAGIPEDLFHIATQETHEAREYVVQYRESDFDFVSRLMEEEGMFYYFEHTGEGHKMIIGDSPTAHNDLPNANAFPFRPHRGMGESTQHFQDVLHREEVQIGKVSLDDYNFQQPAGPLDASVAADTFTSLEHYDFPGRYTQKSVGDHFANVRLQAFQAEKSRIVLWGDVRLAIPGYKMELQDHPAARYNANYVITSVTQTGSQPQSAAHEAAGAEPTTYESQVEVLPTDIPFRAPRRTPKPRVRGALSAVVTGPSGEEIYTDKYGRVKVRFHWDREGGFEETSSCWMRVMQGSAGGGYGIFFLPRVGQEVIIDFIDGDPDQPYIAGSVYNNDQMPPYSLPDNKTRSVIKTNSSKGGGGTCEIRFEDKKGEEQLMIFSQKDYHERCENDHVAKVGANQSLVVGGDQMTVVHGSVHRAIDADFLATVGGNFRNEIGGDHALTVGGNMTQSIGGNLGLIAGGSLVLEAADITLKAGGSFIKIDSSGVAVSGTMIKLNSGGAAGTHSKVNISTELKGPAEADKGDPGADVTYGGSGEGAGDQVKVARIGTESEDEQYTEESSWIEVVLKDDEGAPVPYERYRVVLPNGRAINGFLDENGYAKVAGIPDGNCEVTFPDLDLEAWGRG